MHQASKPKGMGKAGESARVHTAGAERQMGGSNQYRETGTGSLGLGADQAQDEAIEVAE